MSEEEIDYTAVALAKAASELTPEDLDRIIAHERKMRGVYEAGERPKRGVDPNRKSLKELLSLPGPVKVTGGPMRRL